jgi:hypothetical protein
MVIADTFTALMLYFSVIALAAAFAVELWWH